MYKWQTLSAICILSALSGTCSAQSFYAGMTIGQSEVDVSDIEKSTGFKITGGYSFNDFFGLELSYSDFGTMDFSSNAEAEVAALLSELLLGSGVTLIDSSMETNPTAFDLSLVGSYPINETFNIYTRVGFSSWEIESTVHATVAGPFGTESTTESASIDGTDLLYGLGAAFAISDTLSLGLDYTNYVTEESDTTLLGVFVQAQFH